jgi:8-oxo-dGTP pyrophosphatase MutT (NUDIX family)
MHFERFIEALAREFKKDLPGETAQLNMSPLGRANREQARALVPNPKPSAVLVHIFNKNGVPHTLLMKRNSYHGVHSAQMSFPGGKLEMFDKNLLDTALREFEEEMGISARQFDLLGELTGLIIPPSGFEVSPFVTFSHQNHQWNPDPVEVATVVEVPLTDLFHPDSKVKSIVNAGGGKYKLKAPSYKIENHVIWGATAMIISELEELAKRTGL